MTGHNYAHLRETMQSDLAQASTLLASSEHDPGHRAERARFHCSFRDGAQTWSAGANDCNQWIAVAFPGVCRVYSVATYGRAAHNQFIRSYRIEYSVDNASFTALPQEFTGNTDHSTVVTNELEEPIIARVIRIRPVAWNGHISTKLAVYGSFLE